MARALKDFKAGETRRKMLTLQDVEVKVANSTTDPDIAGEIEGFAAGLLNIDRGQDIIFPGAFDKDLADFKQEGVVCYQHDWTAVIGKPTFVEERLEPEYGLFTKSDIISTTLGSDVMKLVRKNALKKLSIGYRLKEGGYAVLNREALVATLKERKISEIKQSEILSDFDKRKLSEVFGLFEVQLFEYSVVTRPMNPNADITGVKGELTGGSLLDGLPFAENPLVVLDAIKGYSERLKDSCLKYSVNNRSVSLTHREGIASIRKELEVLLPQVKEVENLVNSDPASKGEIDKILQEVLLLDSRLLGVAI